MNGKLKKPVFAALFVFACVLFFADSETVNAGGYIDELYGGVTAVLSNWNTGYTSEQLVNQPVHEENRLVMANVISNLNVRTEPDEESERVGVLYKDCGGTILEKGDGWTLIRSGNVIGWVKDEFLLFGDEAVEAAGKVGKKVAKVTSDTVRVRVAPEKDAEVLCFAPYGALAEVIDTEYEGFVCVDYIGTKGYIVSDYVTFDYVVDAGETNEELSKRIAEEEEAKRYVQYEPIEVDEETYRLLATLIHCEACGEPYEGQVAVGAVVLNRVRSSRFPDNIHDVIYQSGQFSPAVSGKLDRIYYTEPEKVYPSCFDAATEALSGYSNVGDLMFFRTVNGIQQGLVINNHVFFDTN